MESVLERGGVPLVFWWSTAGSYSVGKLKNTLVNLRAIALRSLHAKLLMLEFVYSASNLIETDYTSITEVELKSTAMTNLELSLNQIQQLIELYKANTTNTLFVFIQKSLQITISAMQILTEILIRLPNGNTDTAREFLEEKRKATHKLCQTLVSASLQ